jgi:uncharacterized protein (DUF1015 family)
VDALADRVTATEPLYDFVAPDGIGHTVWRADAAATEAAVTALRSVPALYIADGHHRAASAVRAHAHFAGGAGVRDDAEHAWFLGVAFPDNQTQILPYNRTVRDLASRTPGAFLEEVKRRFEVRRGRPSPARKGECAMFLAGEWHAISLRPPGQSPPPDPLEALDVSVLQQSLLDPLLDVVDPRTDKRIDFVGGIRGTGELERAVTSGAAAVAFALFPVTVDELMAIADAGSIMPPKSTWFEPKLRDGLLNHVI